MSNLNKFGITEAQMLALANKCELPYQFGSNWMAKFLSYSQELLALAAPASGAAVFCADCERHVTGPCNSEIRCEYEGAKAVESGAALSEELPPLHKAARNVVAQFNDPHVSLASVARYVNELEAAIAHQPPKEALTPKEIHRIADECGMYQQHDNAMPSSDVVESFAEAIEAATGPNKALTWQKLTAAGQVKKGDYVRFNLCGESKVHQAALILNAGTDKEEIIYHKRNNWYLITSMSIKGEGSQKNVEFLPVIAALSAAGVEVP